MPLSRENQDNSARKYSNSDGERASAAADNYIPVLYCDAVNNPFSNTKKRPLV